MFFIINNKSEWHKKFLIIINHDILYTFRHLIKIQNHYEAKYWTY